MRKRTTVFPSLAGLGAILFVATSIAGTTAQDQSAVRINADDIGGIVTSTKGPEAGVWVITETTDLPANMVVVPRT